MTNAEQTATEQAEVRTLKELDQALGQVLHEMDEAMQETDRAVDAAEELLRA
jgi:hypothetical protein